MSCDKIITPCQESGEVPPLKGCPPRAPASSRNAEAPVVKKEAPLPDMAPIAKKEAAKEEVVPEAKLA